MSLKIFSYGDITNIAFDVLHGLSFLNAQGIVHRNLSPENILLTPKVNNWKLFFNSLCHLDRRYTSQNSIILQTFAIKLNSVCCNVLFFFSLWRAMLSCPEVAYITWQVLEHMLHFQSGELCQLITKNKIISEIDKMPAVICRNLLLFLFLSWNSTGNQFEPFSPLKRVYSTCMV